MYLEQIEWHRLEMHNNLFSVRKHYSFLYYFFDKRLVNGINDYEFQKNSVQFGFLFSEK